MAEPSVNLNKIPFPLSSFPGLSTQESAGRLINCAAEPLGEQSVPSGPSPQVWRRQPGFTRFATTPETAHYRGGLAVNNLSYEIWGDAYTVDATGHASLLGPLPGTKPISIAQDQRRPLPDVVVVDPDNGAFVLTTPDGVPASPIPYNGLGGMPQPNSVAFQDSYFFYTIDDGRVFASTFNSVGAINSLTFVTIEAKSDVELLRGIAFSGVMWFFTTGHCEVWQDVAAVAPSFPYSRMTVIEYGLIQSGAIAGWETGFGILCWVAQDFGVWSVTPGSFQPTKLSPPDLDRLIEVQVRAGNLVTAGCYVYAGKKFWTISSPAWTWEINLQTSKWNERKSLSAATGDYGRWRFTGGHPYFNKWLGGDQQSGNLITIDDQNFTEDGAPLLFRLESGVVTDFPNQLRIARADFYFVQGVGIATSPLPNVVNPTVAIWLSKDGGQRWGNPLLRQIGQQAHVQRPRASVKSMGLSGPMGCRWRLDMTDPVYCAFLLGTMSSDPREVGM